MQNRDFWSRITSLCGSQTSPVVLCVQNSVMRLRLYVSQPSSVVFACKKAWLASESLVSMGPSPHVWFLDAKQRFWTRITDLYESQTSPVVLCMQYSVISTWITSLYGSQPSSVVFACKTATFDQSTSLYGYQTSHVVLCMQNSVICTRMKSLHWFQPSSVFLCM